MTVVRIRQSTGINAVEFGLNIGTEGDLQNGIKQSYIASAIQHVIDVIEINAQANGLSSVKFIGMFPEFTNEKDEELRTEMRLPLVAIIMRLGNQREVGIGRTAVGTEDGPAKAFNQSATIEFDVYGDDQNVADRIAGSLSLLFQRHLFDFVRKGFQNMKTVFSRPAKGWNQNIQWDFETLWYPHRVQRHMIHVMTYFDVVWIEKEESGTTITQIVWKNTGDVIFEYSMGNSLAYLLVEDIEFNWHNGILV